MISYYIKNIYNHRIITSTGCGRPLQCNLLMMLEESVCKMINSASRYYRILAQINSQYTHFACFCKYFFFPVLLNWLQDKLNKLIIYPQAGQREKIQTELILISHRTKRTVRTGCGTEAAESSFNLSHPLHLCFCCFVEISAIENDNEMLTSI